MKVVLLGGSELLLDSLDHCLEKGFSVSVISSARHVDEVFLTRSIRSVAENNDVRLTISDDVNGVDSNSDHFGPDAIGLAFGASWVFERSTVRQFGLGLFDVMCIDVPRYKGGAHHTWQILNCERLFGMCVQKVVGGRANFHRGPVITRIVFNADGSPAAPVDLFELHKKHCRPLLDKFLRTKGWLEDGLSSDDRYARYFPFLSTQHQAYIDWSWEAEDIASFINAFGRPYTGASSFVKGTRYQLLGKGSVLKEKCHPFAAGLVLNKVGKKLILGCAPFAISFESEEELDVDVGDRFYTPLSVLDEVRRTEIKYDSKGLVRKVF